MFYSFPHLKDLPSDFQVSSSTRDKAQFAKDYIEMKYSKLSQQKQEKSEEWKQIEKRMNEIGLSQNEKNIVKSQLIKTEALNLREDRKRMTIFDFEPETLIGRGAFGEVYIVRYKKTDEVFAMKRISKEFILNKNQTGYVKAERSLMALADFTWIVDLKFSFQDERYLYLVMEYMPGGDFLNLMIRKNKLEEHEAQFYIAECILALEKTHQLNYVHRDIKPDNILIDRSGHLKLADFGLCKRNEDFDLENFRDDANNPSEGLAKRSRKMLNSLVGTYNYIAPEIVMKEGYDESVDWWSIGVLLYEMVLGYAPFDSDSATETYKKIIDWESSLVIPENSLSADAADLIKQLICGKETRLCDVGLIKSHPFFKGIDWGNIKDSQPPWVPELESDVDCKYFDVVEEEKSFYPPIPFLRQKNKKRETCFVGFTYRKDCNRRVSLVSAFENLESVQSVLGSQGAE